MKPSRIISVILLILSAIALISENSISKTQQYFYEKCSEALKSTQNIDDLFQTRDSFDCKQAGFLRKIYTPIAASPFVLAPVGIIMLLISFFRKKGEKFNIEDLAAKLKDEIENQPSIEIIDAEKINREIKKSRRTKIFSGIFLAISAIFLMKVGYLFASGYELNPIGALVFLFLFIVCLTWFTKTKKKISRLEEDLFLRQPKERVTVKS